MIWGLRLLMLNAILVTTALGVWMATENWILGLFIGMIDFKLAQTLYRAEKTLWITSKKVSTGDLKAELIAELGVVPESQFNGEGGYIPRRFPPPPPSLN
jgi:hypothetical protein